MVDANVNEKSPGWRRLAAFRSNYVAECNSIAYELFPELPRNRYTYENLKDSQKKRVFEKYKKLVKKAGRNKGKKRIEVNPVNLENFDDTEKLLEISKKVGIPSGMHVINPDEKKLKLAIDYGYRFIAYSLDAVFLHKNVINPI